MLSQNHVLKQAFLLSPALFFGFAAQAQTSFYISKMTGLQEVPPVISEARGIGRLRVNTETGAISGEIGFCGLSGPATAAHIHQGFTATNGPVIVKLLYANSTDECETYSIPNPTTLTREQLDLLQHEGLYFNVHTTLNKGGEMRGQIVPRAEMEPISF